MQNSYSGHMLQSKKVIILPLASCMTRNGHDDYFNQFQCPTIMFTLSSTHLQTDLRSKSILPYSRCIVVIKNLLWNCFYSGWCDCVHIHWKHAGPQIAKKTATIHGIITIYSCSLWHISIPQTPCIAKTIVTLNVKDNKKHLKVIVIQCNTGADVKYNYTVLQHNNSCTNSMVCSSQ